MQNTPYLTDRLDRPVCVGNGETCQRLTNQGVEQHPCPSPDLCPLAQGGNCKPYGRLHVNLDESDEFGTFIFRTTGFNSIRTLAARLSYYHAASEWFVVMPTIAIDFARQEYDTELSSASVLRGSNFKGGD